MIRYVQIFLGVALLAIFILSNTFTKCRAQSGEWGAGHEEHHEQYKNWHRPDGMHCCSEGDCRPTRAYMGDDGLWRAWDGKVWVTIPAQALMAPDKLKDGRSHFCGPPWGGAAYCFSPAEPKI